VAAPTLSRDDVSAGSGARPSGPRAP
jgi:hypothetical protein